MYCFQDDGVRSSILGFHPLPFFIKNVYFTNFFWGLGLGHGFGGAKKNK
jgi:hypothetical protein